MHVLNPIARLPKKGFPPPNDTVDISFVEMTPELINIWASEIQPIINSHYKKFPRWLSSKSAKDKQACIDTAENETDTNSAVTLVDIAKSVHTNNEVQKKTGRYRADVKWSWKNLFWWHSLNNYIGEHTTLIGQSNAICMVLRKNGRTFPIGMLIVVPKFSSIISGDKSHRAFAWYFADAPSEFYKAIKHPKIKNVADALLDYSIQLGSQCNGYRSLLLHASPRGGDRLKHFYRSDCGMTAVPVAVTAVSTARFLFTRKDYFFFDNVLAKEFSAKYDVYRRYSPTRFPVPQSAPQGA